MSTEQTPILHRIKRNLLLLTIIGIPLTVWWATSHSVREETHPEYIRLALAMLQPSEKSQQPFAPAPFLLEMPRPAEPPVPIASLHLDLPIGPIRIDYGHPIAAANTQRFNFNGDFPGPGYREQRARFLNK